jgi:hypothetical protein
MIALRITRSNPPAVAKVRYRSIGDLPGRGMLQPIVAAVLRVAATTLSVSVVALTLAVAVPATSVAQDDCGAAAYCIPAPPATAKAKRTATKKARKALDRPVDRPQQAGVALVSVPRASVARPRRSRSLRLIAVSCTSACRVSATFDLTLGGRTTHPADRSLRLRAGGSGSLPVRISAGRGGGRLVAHLTIDDDYGTHTAEAEVVIR